MWFRCSGPDLALSISSMPAKYVERSDLLIEKTRYRAPKEKFSLHNGIKFVTVKILWSLFWHLLSNVKISGVFSWPPQNIWTLWSPIKKVQTCNSKRCFFFKLRFYNNVWCNENQSKHSTVPLLSNVKISGVFLWPPQNIWTLWSLIKIGTNLQF